MLGQQLAGDLGGEPGVEQPGQHLGAAMTPALALGRFALELESDDGGHVAQHPEVGRRLGARDHDHRRRPRRRDRDRHHLPARNLQSQDRGHRLGPAITSVPDRGGDVGIGLARAGNQTQPTVGVQQRQLAVDDLLESGHQIRARRADRHVPDGLIQPQRVEHTGVLLAAVGLGHGLDDGVERHLVSGDQHRERELVGERSHLRVQWRRVHPVADRDPAEARAGEPLQVGVLLRSRLRNAQPSGQQQVALTEPLGRVAQLAHVRPRDFSIQARLARVAPRAQRRNRDQLSDRDRHRAVHTNVLGVRSSSYCG